MTFRLLLGVLLAMWIALGAAFLIEELPGGHGVPHDEFTAMLQGGPVASPAVAFLAWAFGALQIALFVALMTLGITRRRPVDSELAQAVAARWKPTLLFAAGVAAYLGAFTAMVGADRAAITSGEVTFLGPFPAATSWMLFGLWAAPLLFVAAYIVGFSQWIFSDENLARFEELVAQSERSHRQTTS